MLRIPTYLQTSTDAGGPARAAWLAALPGRVTDLTDRWQLTLGEPFEPGGNCSWVAPGIDGDGRDIVLKVAWRHTEALHEAEGLAAVGAAAATAVFAFEHDGDATVMLLERCDPGVELRGQPEATQHLVITGLLRAVWSVELPPAHPFRPLSEMAHDWIARAELRIETSSLDHGLARDGLALFRELAQPTANDVLLFTDAHAGNVLSGTRQPWLLIDPKPYVGDPHYDVVQHLLNCNASLRADPVALISEVADLAGLDVDRVRQWLFARCVEESLRDEVTWPGLNGIIATIAD